MSVRSGSKQLRLKWQPHEKQREILQSPARFRVCACGRRFGKTMLARYDGIDFALEVPGSYVWWIEPNYEDANELGYEPIKRILDKLDMVADYRLREPRYIDLPNGSRISFRSADNPNSLQGRGVDLVVIDEAASIKDETYYADIRPVVTDTAGDILLIGTPDGRNYFYELFEQGNDPDNLTTESFQYSAYQNPHVPDYEIDSAKAQQPERVFKQEYLAIFAEAEGAVFPGVWNRNCITYDIGRYRGPSPYHIGVDLGRKKNYAAISVLDATGQLNHFERMRQMSWGIIENRCKRVASNYNPSQIRMDASRDNQIVENIEGAVPHTTVEPVSWGGKTKRRLIENLAARLELSDIMLPDQGEEIDIILPELRAYQYTTTRAGNVSYGPPTGKHDDAVDSLALAAKPGEAQASSGVWGRDEGRAAAQRPNQPGGAGANGVTSYP